MKSLTFPLLILVFSLFSMNNSLAIDLDCSTLFNGLPRSPYPCTRAQEANFPRVISGVPVDFFHYKEGYSGDEGQKELIRKASQALDESISVLLQYGAVPPLNVIFTNEIVDHSVASAGWFGVPAGKPCGIQLYFNIDTNLDQFKQVVAHEVAHCFQAKNIFVPEMPLHYSAQWWVEGFAEYLSSVVYPRANREWFPEKSFEPSLPLFSQTSPYQNSLFFKYINQTGLSIQTIIQLLKTHPTQNSLPQEYTAFSNWNSIADRFHEFALALSNRSITDSSGSIQPIPEIPLYHVELSSTEKELKLPGKSDATRLIEVKIPRAGIWKIQWKGNPSSRVSYRSKGMAWQKLEPFSEITFDLDCGSAGSTFEILWTSTEPQEDTELTLMTEAAPKDCRCADVNSVLDSCLKGKWKININESNDAIRRYMEEHTNQTGGELSFYGDQILNIQEGKANSVYTLNQYGNHLRVNLPTGESVIQTEINGTMNTTFTTNRADGLCVKDEFANALVHTWMDGEDQGIVPYEVTAFDPTPMLYSCDSSHLHLFFDTTDPTFPVYIQQILVFDRVK